MKTIGSIWRHSQNFANARSKRACAAIVVGETAGEASTLTPAEHDTIIRAAVEIARGRVRVIAGAGSNSTSQAIELTRRAEAAGADAVLSVVPTTTSRCRPAFDAHFRGDRRTRPTLPIILHDIPSRTIRELADDTLARLAESRQFIGLRDGDRRCCASDAPAFAAAAGVPTAVRRRRNRAGLCCQWRGRLHIDGIECRAGSVSGDFFELQAGTVADREISAKSAGAADGRASPRRARLP